jgi:putative ABC transport system permease protein
MRTADLLQFNLRLLLRQRFRTLMSLLANDAGGLAACLQCSGADHAHR